MKILNKNKAFTRTPERAQILFSCVKRSARLVCGFTLVEMLVTALIFSIVMGAATGVFVSAIKLQRYNLAHQQLLSQASYALEYMDRAIRMAIKDDGFCGFAGQNYEVSDENRKIKFKNYKGECQEFFWDTSDNQLKVYKEIVFGTPLPLTSNDFEVMSFNFQVSGDIPGDDTQPRVTVSMGIKGKGSGQQPGIKIQTTVSQRNLDLDLPVIQLCGNGIIDALEGEVCDDGDWEIHDACPDGPFGTCLPAWCGDNIAWNILGPEDCDGSDDAACPGLCQPNCVCP